MSKLRKHFFLVICCAILICTGALGVVFRCTIPNCGLSNITNIKDLQNYNIALNYAWGDEDESGFITESHTGAIPYDLDASDIIAIVSPTGNIDQTEGSVGQEIIIKKIIQGDTYITIGQEAYVYQYFGLQAVDGHMEFLNTLNLMYPDNDYLIFMDSSPLNSYQEKKAYILKSEILGYIKTNHTDTPTLDKNYKGISFSDLTNYEFFSTSEVVAQRLNEVRVNLLKLYCAE